MLNASSLSKIKVWQYAFLFYFALVAWLYADNPDGVKTEAPADTKIVELAPLIVTGSNIELDETETFSPIITLSQEAIQLQGSQTPIESLRRLPSFAGSTLTENLSNGGMGNASVSLRGQGPLATLTLINGRRAGGSGAISPPRRPGGFADIMLIPLIAVKEIEVVQDGASSTYGSDAIAGAINLLLHTDYDGTRLDVTYGNTTDKDAAVKQLSFLTGTTADKTHITVAGSFYQRNAIARVDRELSQSGDFTDRGSIINYNASFPTTGDVFYQDGTFTTGPDFNPNSITTDIPEQQIISVFSAIEHAFTERLSVYSDFLYSSNQSDSKIYPNPWFSPDYLIDAANDSPFKPASQTVAGFFYNLEALGGFKQEWESEGIRLVGGVKGTLQNTIDWDLGALHTETDITGNFSGSIVDGDALASLIRDGLFNPITTAPGNAALLRSIAVPLVNAYKETMSLADFKLKGDLFELPAGPCKFAAGIEFRYESIEFVDDPIHDTINVLGWDDISHFSGNRNAAAVFVESILPVVAEKDAITGIRSLKLNFGGRFENFSDEGIDPSASSTNRVKNNYNSFDYKVAMRFEPIEPIVFRASFNTAFRAPTLAESYSQYDAINRIRLNDPTGATTIGTAIPTFFRGNANLQPETSHSFSFGTAFQPVDGFTFKIDYYDIQREDAIVNGAQFIVDQAAANPSGPLADLVVRNPSTNAIQSVNSIYFNAADVITRGIEYQVHYHHAFSDKHTLDVTLGANQFLTFKVKASPESGYESFKGKTVDSTRNDISPGSIPTWKGYLQTRWTVDNCTFGSTIHYVGSYKDDGNFTSTPVETDVASYTTLDLVFRYELPTSLATIFRDSSVILGVNNVFDRPPPFSAGSLAGPPLGGYDQSLYSQRNRYWYVNITKAF